MKKILSIIYLSLIMVLAIKANSAEELFSEANTAYKNDNYEQASELYESLLTKGYESAILYFNLGNSYFKSNRLAPAILNYEKGKKLDPTNEDIKYNLELAKSRTIDRFETLPTLEILNWWKGLIAGNSPKGWAMLSIFSFILGLLLVSVYLFSFKVLLKKASFWIALPLFIFTVFTLYFSYLQFKNITHEKQAIIMVPTVTIKGSPNENAMDLFVLHEGTSVSITDNIGEWREIKVSDGNKGWLNSHDIQPY